MNCVAFIFARGGSKGLPGKNIRPLDGKPLIAWSIGHAGAVPRIRRVIVSTDSREIAAVAREHGAEGPFLRPDALAGDHSPEWAAWRHALEFLREDEGALPDAMVSVPTTAPLREPADIERCLDAYALGGADVVVTVTEARGNPWFNMVAIGTDGLAALVNTPAQGIHGRQQAPAVYDMTTVAYVARPEFVLANEGLFAGRVRAVQVPRERAVDIDTLLDFRIAECLRRAGREGT
jgi:N-acylneuraminate cytidylyltransferase